MSELNHSLYNDFPEHRSQIEKLKNENPLFAEKAAEYHKLDHSVRGLQMSEIPASDHRFEEMKMRRLKLKDELYQMLM